MNVDVRRRILKGVKQKKKKCNDLKQDDGGGGGDKRREIEIDEPIAESQWLNRKHKIDDDI